MCFNVALHLFYIYSTLSVTILSDVLEVCLSESCLRCVGKGSALHFVGGTVVAMCGDPENSKEFLRVTKEY